MSNILIYKINFYFRESALLKLIMMKLSNFILILIISAFLSANLSAQSNLVIHPKRIVFERNQRTQQINLSNSGSDTAKYSVSFAQIRMKENGEFENITVPDSGQQFADGFLRFYPRTIILGPGESQALKVQLVKPELLNSGEYRSHLYFKEEPGDKPKRPEDKEDAAGPAGLSIKLIPVIGITIPVIIRIGESTASVNISDLSYESQNGAPALSFRLNRTGNMSVYGDLKIEYTSPDGEIFQVANVKGVAVYTPNLTRKLSLELNDKINADYNKGKLYLTYTELKDNKIHMLAEAELILNKDAAN